MTSWIENWARSIPTACMTKPPTPVASVSAPTTILQNSLSRPSAAGGLHMGSERYPNARELLITANGGGGNGYRLRLWKDALQGLANTTGLTVRVCHFPPGTSKWNKIEHRMFSFISLNWR